VLSAIGPRVAWIDGLVASLLSRTGAPGAAAAVVAGGDIVHLAGHGHVGIEAPARPVHPDDAFRIGSITKTMTAVAAMTLVERGRIGLDDPVNEHLRRVQVAPPAGGAAVTLRHLLTHTSGLGDFPGWRNLRRPGALGLVEGRLPTLSESLGPLVRAEVPAGAKYSYSQRGVAIAGQVIEDVAGTPFAEYVASTVFEPVGMSSASLGLSDRVGSRLVPGYSRWTGSPRRLKPREFVLAGAGAGIASANDLAAYAGLLLGRGANAHGQVLRPDTFAHMIEPQYQVCPGFPALGLTFWLEELGGNRVFGHGGMYPGYAASLLVAPEYDVAVALVINATAFPSLTNPCLVADTARAVVGCLAGLSDRALDLSHHAVAWDPVASTGVEGRYRLGPGFVTNGPAHFAGAGRITVSVRRGRLWLRGFPVSHAIELHAIDPSSPLRFRGRWYGRAGSTIDAVFRRGPSGDIDTLHLAHPGFGFIALSRRPPRGRR
jgi:CubicO group peptidase (beta-lactamase class C family)